MDARIALHRKPFVPSACPVKREAYFTGVKLTEVTAKFSMPAIFTTLNTFVLPNSTGVRKIKKRVAGKRTKS